MASPRGEADSTPICRCRVLYLGSAVPHVTKDGLQGIQEPLRELYPEQGALGARGIDSWLSVWSNGLLLENVDENHKKVTRFFPIDSLHYCAAVRYVLVPEKLSSGPSQPATPRFLPLDSPFARTPNPSHPPLFAAILRRTTGIKVLECHAFICKREMAANALVRCCFHAYADSSYARNIDGGSSIYGTLRSQSQNTNNNPPPPLNNSFDKVEGWRRMSPGQQETRGSTLTLNSQHNGTLKSNGTLDNISIYNGDENHKVWAGPGGPLDREELYGNYNGSTMRSTKSVRPRQMVAPVAVPPPPPPPKEDKKTAKKTQKERARRKKMVGGNREELYPVMNGSLMRPGTQMRTTSSMSAPQIYSNGGTLMRPTNGTLMRPTNGTLMRPTNGYHPHHHPHPHHHQQQQQPVILMHPNATLPHPRQMQGGKRAGTFSHRPKGMMVRPVPPPFIPHPLPPQMVPIHTNNKRQPKMMEEPVYMPSARPMSPVASYQPAHFPHEAYLMQQYANQTMDKPGKKKSKAKKVNGENGDEDGIEVEESPYNTGIYRKKGHMNERAFSYSIRQEHRSRSYGSLANLKFATPIPNGGGPTGSKEEFKKEREIMQMMTDLDLSGDELERREVPAGVYQHQNPAVYHSRQSLTVAGQNGRR